MNVLMSEMQPNQPPSIDIYHQKLQDLELLSSRVIEMCGFEAPNKENYATYTAGWIDTKTDYRVGLEQIMYDNYYLYYLTLHDYADNSLIERYAFTDAHNDPYLAGIKGERLKDTLAPVRDLTDHVLDILCRSPIQPHDPERDF